MGRLVGACISLAAVSLLLPSEPSYDPWAWLVWGQQIAHGTLNTAGGPSWKPLPAAFAALATPTGAAPALWLVAGRAGGLLALALAWRLAVRLSGGSRLAGAVAVVALALTPDWLRYLAHGSEAPAAVALMLWAVERHLDGRRDQALVLGVLACLMRPEAFAFVGPYAARLWAREPGRRRLVAAAVLSLPLLWLVPDWLGSGHPLGAGAKATGEPSWSLSLRDHPWLEALRRAHAMTGPPVELAALGATAVALRRRDRVVLALAAGALLWLLLYVVMTQVGFSGNPRYLLPAMAIACILAGVAAAGAREALVFAGPRAPAGAAALALAAAGPWLADRAALLGDQAADAREMARLHSDLGRAVDAFGGPSAVLARGRPTVDRPFMTHLAWELHKPIRWVARGTERGLVFTADSPLSFPPAIVRIRPPGPRRVVERVGDWQVYRLPPPTLITEFSHSRNR
jgi:hypothetical protein